MANEIRIGIGVDGERQAEHALKGVGDQAEKTGDQIEELGDQAVAAGKSSDKAGQDFRGAADQAEFLNRRVVELKASYKDLLRQLDETGDTSLLQDIGKERRQLKKFEGLVKDNLPAPADVVKDGTSLGSSLMAGVSAGVKAGGPYVTGALVAVAALAAPGIATTLGAAIVGGVGVGGIIGGVALAAKDPRVQDAGKAVGETLVAEFRDAADGFVDPLLRSLEKVGSAGWADKLGPTFDKLATKVDPLTDGLLGLIDNALPGLEHAAQSAGPSLDVLAEGLPQIGAAIGDFFNSISDDPETLADGLELFIDATSDAIKFTGDFIEVLIGLYSIAYDVAEVLGVISEDEMMMKRVTRETGDEVKNLAVHTDTAEKALRDFDAAIADVFGRTLDVHEATLRYEQSIDDLTEELTNGKRTLDEHTQAGRDNWQAINEVSKAVEDQREANVANGMSMDEANAKYARQLEDLRKTLLGLGYNKKAVNDYIDSLKAVPAKALTEVHVKGIKEAIADAKELADVLGGIVGYGITAAVSKPGGRATGGAVNPYEDYIVGEEGPELLRLGASGGYVFNNSQTKTMLGIAPATSSTQAKSDGATYVSNHNYNITAYGVTDAQMRAWEEAANARDRVTRLNA